MVVLDEEIPLQPGDIYGYTKLAGEEMCRQSVRQHGIDVIALRFGMFVPESFLRYGIRLLYGGVDVDDVARSVVAAIGALAVGGVGFRAFNVHSFVPFRPEDGPVLRTDPIEAVDRHYPGARQILRERGIDRLDPIQAIYPMPRIAEALGFRPEHNFDRWLEEVRGRPASSASPLT